MQRVDTSVCFCISKNVLLQDVKDESEFLNDPKVQKMQKELEDLGYVIDQSAAVTNF